jgi:hypothetical protein
MSGWVGLHSADLPAAWLSAVLVGGLFLEDCAIWDEPDSEAWLHQASTRTNKDAASMHPNLVLFTRATMVAPSLTVTLCVSYGNQRTTHRGTIPHSRPDNRSSKPSTCPDTVVHTHTDLSGCLVGQFSGSSRICLAATKAFKVA